MSKIDYPLYFLDFETYMSAVPEFDNTRSWQKIPFQFSIHYKESKTSDVKHYSYLADSTGDPRPELIMQMLNNLGSREKILVYYQGFEETIIRELSRDFPVYETGLLAVAERLDDMCIPFRDKYYYTHEMRSKYSLKKVLPALCPDLSYDELEIKEGGSASNEFVRCRKINDKSEIQKIRSNLIKYCERDTYGLVRILEELEKLI